MKTAVETISLNKNSLFRDFLLVIGSGLFIAWIGSVTIALPFTPVPLSFRLQAILLISYFLGAKRALTATAVFLSLGAVGLPIFANHSFGIAALLGPSGGFILGYLFSSLVVGYMSDCHQKPLKTFLVGTLVTFIAGIAHLTCFFGFAKALQFGLYPFILGDFFIKLLCILKLESAFSEKGLFSNIL